MNALFSERAKSYYDSIVNHKAAEGIRGVLDRWSRFAANKAKLGNSIPIVIPDMLWASRAGGCLGLARMVADYLASAQIMEFHGDVRVFEFKLHYMTEAHYFTELPRLTEAVAHAAGFRAEYKGVILLDIDEWRNHLTEPHFLSLINYVTSNADNWLLIFTIGTDKEEEVTAVEGFLSLYMRIEKVILRFPRSEEILEMLAKQLNAYGFELSQNARTLLHESIEALSSSRFFDNPQSIKLFATDIIYSVMASDNCDILISGAELAGFTRDSAYVARLRENTERRRQIGFFNGSEAQK